MTAQILDGEAVAQRITDLLRTRIEVLADRGITPGLGTLLVGDDGPSANYVNMKHRDCEALGIQSYHLHLPSTATQDDVFAAVKQFNDDPSVDAFLMQHPFPDHLDYEACFAGMDPAKDVDGLHPVNLGKLVQGMAGPRPCTAVGIVELLSAHDISVAGQHVVIVGRGVTVGRPLANLLTLKEPGANAAVTVVHTGVSDLAPYTRQADILVAAAGSPGIITPDMVKPGAVVIRAGVKYEGRKAISDVVDEVDEVAGWVSPRLGGVGAMTRAMLMSNAVAAAEKAADGL